jgi:phage shock protein A
MNKAMAQLNATLGEDVPTFEEVRDKIERKLAKAQGMSDLSGATVESKMLEVEQAQMSAESQARLSELRSELGLAAPEEEKAPAEAQPAPAEQPKPAEKPAAG